MTDYTHERTMQKRKLEICSEAAQNIQECINSRFLDVIRSNWQGDDANLMIGKLESIAEAAGNVQALSETIKSRVDMVYNSLETEERTLSGGGGAW